MPIKHAAIIGAGVAGLTTALALARHGIGSDIFEQATALTEVGAGLQISPNASRVLRELELLDALEAVWTEPRSIAMISGRSLRRIASIPSGEFARLRWGASYGAVHRATLQRILLAAVEANPLCHLHLGKPFDGRDPQAIAAATSHLPDVIIGADGVWSKVRNLVPDAPSPRFSGNIAWRFTVAMKDAPRILDPDNVSAFLGRSSHLICYPLREQQAFNIVAIITGRDGTRDWNATGNEAQRAALRTRFSGWNTALSSLIESAADATFWPLYEVGPGRWHNGRDTILIGDAAHAMTPFAAQGAAMAIEDGFELAGLLARLAVPDALNAFEKRRNPRIAHLRQRAAFNRFAYHASGPVRIGRDLVLALRPPQSVAADLDWIYGYKAIG